MITQQELKAILEYDSKNGLWRWRDDYNLRSRKKGWFPGTLNGKGYFQIKLGPKIYTAHTLAWLYTYGEIPKSLDHINRDGKDNRIVNLRLATQAENNYNVGLSNNNNSGYKGIYYAIKYSRWIAHIKKDGYQIRKRFIRIENAIEWRKKMEEELFGEFAPKC